MHFAGSEVLFGNPASESGFRIGSFQAVGSLFRKRRSRLRKIISAPELRKRRFARTSTPLNFGSAVLGGAGGNGRRHSGRGPLEPALRPASGTPADAPWKPALRRKAAQVPARAEVSLLALAARFMEFALGTAAAQAVRPWPRKEPAAKISAFQSPGFQNFRAFLKARPRLNGRKIAPRPELPGASLAEQFSDNARARPPRDPIFGQARRPALTTSRSAAGTPKKAQCLIGLWRGARARSCRCALRRLRARLFGGVPWPGLRSPGFGLRGPGPGF